MTLFPLNVSGAVSRRRGNTLVGPVDLEISGPSTTVVIGPNGAGKSTLLALLHGTARLSAGAISWACPLEEARQAQAFVFQHPIVLRRSVIENIAYPLLIRGVRRKPALAEAETWAARVGLEAMLHRSALSLSGGEQQKLALVRALITKPAFVFLDEPSASLDSQSMRVIESVLSEAKAAGTALMLATHDMGQARRLADKVVFLLAGRIHEAAPAGAFFDGPETSEAAAFLRGDIVG